MNFSSLLDIFRSVLEKPDLNRRAFFENTHFLFACKVVGDTVGGVFRKQGNVAAVFEDPSPAG